MNNIKLNGRVGQTFAGIALSVTIAFTGSLIITPQTTHAATASSKTTSTASKTTTTSDTATTSETTNTSKADQIIETGKQFIGIPYHFGAVSGRTNMFDCSSFTQYVFKQNGIDLPRSSREQAKTGKAVTKDQLQPGDLVFSDTNHDGVINHVSIYIGDGKLLHTYRVGIGVTISEFDGSAWDRSFVTARRVIAEQDQSADTPDDSATTDQQDNGDAQGTNSASDNQTG